MTAQSILPTLSYKRPYWTQEIPADNPRGVYRVSPEGKVSKVAGDLKQPNGIIGDAKNRQLYVADIGDGKNVSLPGSMHPGNSPIGLCFARGEVMG